MPSKWNFLSDFRPDGKEKWKYLKDILKKVGDISKYL